MSSEYGSASGSASVAGAAGPSATTDSSSIREESSSVRNAENDLEQGALIHIHLDLDTDAGLQQAQSLLSAVFAGHRVASAGAPSGAGPSTVAEPHVQPVAPGMPPGQLSVPAMPAVGTPAEPAMPAPALFPQHASPATAAPAAPDNMSLLQQLIHGVTPRRRPGRPSRAESEFRALLNSVASASLPAQASASAAAAAAPRPLLPCKICNQSRADVLLRNCGHTVCRTCVLPYISLRPVCPITGCNLSCNVNNDLIPISLN